MKKRLLILLLVVALASVIVSLNASLVFAQPADDHRSYISVNLPRMEDHVDITVGDGDGIRQLWAFWAKKPFNDIIKIDNPGTPYTFTIPFWLTSWPGNMVVQVQDQIGWVTVFAVYKASGAWDELAHFYCNGTMERYYWTEGVGGIVVPIDKFSLLVPYIGLASTILVATVATAIYVKRVKRRKEKQ